MRGSRAYSDPQDSLADYAKIVVVNAAPQSLYTRLYDDAIGCAGLVTYTNTPLNQLAPGDSRIIYARKGEPLTVGAWYGATQYTGYSMRSTLCPLNTTFVPTAGSYKLLFSDDEGSAKCRMAALQTDGAKPVPVPAGKVFLRKNHQPFFSGGSWCSDLSEEQVAALQAQRAPSAH